MSDEQTVVAITNRGMSPSIKDLAAALSKAQAEIHGAKRDKTNPHFNSQYSTLAEVWDVVREPLTKNGLSVTQLPTVQVAESTGPEQIIKGMVLVTTILMHTSGEWISSELAQPLKAEYLKTGKEIPPSAHQIGAAITYSRRYALASMLGVTSEEDDDGNSLRGDNSSYSPPAGQPPAAVRSTRTSVYTGKEMDSEQGKAAHQAAAANARVQQPPQQPPQTTVAQPAPTPQAQAQPPTQPPQAAPVTIPGITHPGLAAAMQRDAISIDMLDGYLRGEVGEPRIKNPVIVGGMTLAAMGPDICNSLIKPATWEMICSRIKADKNLPPF